MTIPTRLDVVRENLVFALGEVLDDLPRIARIEVRAKAVWLVSALHRRIGLCELLGDADVAGCLARLGASAQACAALLGRVTWAEVVEPYYLCASRLDGFLDALAGGHLTLAQQIAGRAPAEHHAEVEDPEDHLFVRTLMALLGGGPAAAQPVLAAYVAAVAPPVEDPRLAVCQALCERSEADFEAALTGWLAAREAACRALRAEVAADPGEVATEGRVFVPGLALVRLARHLGLEASGRSALLPAPVLAAAPAALPPEAWRVADWTAQGPPGRR